MENENMAGIFALLEMYAGELRRYSNDTERNSLTEKIKTSDADDPRRANRAITKAVLDQQQRMARILESFSAILLQTDPTQNAEQEEMPSGHSSEDPQFDFSEGVTKSINNLENLTSDQLGAISKAVDSLLDINQNKGGYSLDSQRLCYSLDSQQLRYVDSIHNTINNLTNPNEIEIEISKAIDSEIHGTDKAFNDLFATLLKKKQYKPIIKLCVHLFRQNRGQISFLVPMFESIINLGVGTFQEEESALKYANELLEDWDETFYGVYIEYLVQRLRAGGDKNKVRIEMILTTTRCRERFPLFEFGYYGEAYLYCLTNSTQGKIAAYDILLSAVFEKALPLEPNRKPVYIECPHCCKLLLEKLGSWLDSELVDRACEKGLRGSKNKDKDMHKYFQKYQKNLRAQSATT